MATTTVASGRKTIKETTAADIINIGGDATMVTIAGKMKAGDIINIEGLASDYTASASGRTITLKSDTQTIKFQLDGTAGSASVRFFDGDLTATYGGTKIGAKLGDQKLTKKAADVNDDNLGPNDSSAAVFTQTTTGGSTGGSTGTATASVPFTLTTSTDNINGGSGNDSINGVLQANGATGTTVAPGDAINGGDGTDTLTISVAGALPGAYTLSAVNTNSVERILLNNFDTDATNGNTVDASLMNGVSSFGMNASSAEGDTTFSNIKVAAIGEMRNGAGDLTLSYTTAVLAGTADTQKLTVSSTTAGTFTANGAETIAITSEIAASKITAVASDTLTKVTVDGAQDLTITSAITATTIDAGTMTGGLNITAGANAAHKITGGKGNDTIDMVTQLGSGDTVAGGDGTDTLKVSAGAGTIGVGTAVTKGVFFNVSGVEVIDVASTNDAAILDLNNTVGVTNVVAAANVRSITVTGDITNTAAAEVVKFTLNGVSRETAAVSFAGTNAATEATLVGDAIALAINNITGAPFVAVNAAGTVSVTAVTGEAVELAITAGSAATATYSTQTAYSDVSFTNLAAGQVVDIFSADAVSASLKDASGLTDALTINLKTTTVDKGFNKSVGTITANNIETINLSANGVTDLKVTTVAGLTASAAKTLNITGDSDVTISSFSGTTLLAAIDGSTSKGDLSLAAAPEAINQSIKTGSGNDVITMGAFLTNADTIDGGTNSASDTIGTVGVDIVTATVNGLGVTNGALNISGVERVNLTNEGSATINATAITGAAQIAFLEHANATSTTLTGLAAGTAVGLGHVGVAETATVLGSITASLADASGAADSLTFSLNDTRDADINTATLKTTGIETVNLAYSTTATSLANYTLNVSELVTPKIVVTGSDGNLNNEVILNSLNAATTTIDASAFKGKITATTTAPGAVAVLATGTIAQSITGGAGNDTITLSGNLGTIVQTIAGGTGNDILNVTVDNAASDFTSVSAVETLNITVASNKAAGSANTVAAMTGFNAATNINFLGGDSISKFTTGGTTGVITDSEKVIDASTFSGSIELILAENALDADMSIKGGARTTDKVTTTVSTNTTGEVVKLMSGVETLVLNSATTDTDARIDLANVSGLVNLEAKFTTGGSQSQIAVDKLMSGVTVKVASTKNNDNLVIDLAEKSGSANSLNLQLDTFTGAGDSLNFDAAGVETLNINAKNTNAGLIDLGGVAATSSTGNVTVNVTGTGALTLKALSSLTNVVNASSTTGAIVLASADRPDIAMSITTGEGADTVAMRRHNDTLNAGTGTDTLVISAGMVLGGIMVDLSSTTDQVSTFNGSGNATAQIGFENVDASAVTGSFGVDLTARAAGSIIIGSGNADQISGGAGNDTITGGAGADAISTGAGTNSIIYALETDLFATGTAALTDAITGGAGEDTLTVGTIGTSFAIAAANSFAAATGLEKIVSVANSAAVSITLNANAATAGIHTVDLSAAVTSTGHKIDVGAYTALGTTLIGSSTVLTTIIGGAGADTITGGAGADIVTGGAGADIMNAGLGNDTFILVNNSSGAVTSTTLATPGTFGATEVFTHGAVDKITGFTTGDKIQLYTTGTTAITTIAAPIVAGGINPAADKGLVAAIRGTQTTATTFTAATAGLDTLFIWDIDGTGAGAVYSAVILVGYVDVAADTVTTGGLFTAAV